MLGLSSLSTLPFQIQSVRKYIRQNSSFVCNVCVCVCVLRRTLEFTVKYYCDNEADKEKFIVSIKRILVPIEASLKDVWTLIQRDFSEAQSIKEPVFTLMSDCRDDRPDVVYFGNVADETSNTAEKRDDSTTGKYHRDLFSRREFAHILHDKMDPLRYWSRNDPRYRSMPKSISPGMTDQEMAMQMEYGISTNIVHDDLLMANYGMFMGFKERPFICFEKSEGLLTPNLKSRASNEWTERTQLIRLTVENKATPTPPSIVLKAIKPYQVQALMEELRVRLSIEPSKDIRIWQVKDDVPLLVTFPHAFRTDCRLIVEAERYPRPNESLLCVSVWNEKSQTQSEFVPFLFVNSISVKEIKQQ
ncbi:hypothetical protein RFI_15059, partial [Reticulomyxa filosa]